MSHGLPEQLCRAFEEAHRPPRVDLRGALGRPRRSRRSLRQASTRLVGLLALAVLVAAAISLPGLRAPAPTGPQRMVGDLLPTYGYQLGGEAHDVRGRRERVRLAAVPPGYALDTVFEEWCLSKEVRPVTISAGGKRYRVDFAIYTTDGRLLTFDGSGPCTNTKPTSGREESTAPPINLQSRETVYVVSAARIAWRVVIGVAAHHPGPTTPAAIGDCRQQSVLLSSSPSVPRAPGRRRRVVTFSLKVVPHGPSAACDAQLAVRFELFQAGTERALSLVGNRQVAVLSGVVSPTARANPPRLTFRWTNWCGRAKAVQYAWLDAERGVLIGSTFAVPLPACTDHDSPSRLTLTSAS